MREIAKKSKRWVSFRQALIQDAKIAWPERFCWTDKESLETGKISIEKLREDGQVAFGQNYLLEPYNGDSIITRDLIQYGRVEQYDYIWIGIDPAISENSGTDKMGIVAVGFIENKWKYVIESHGLLGKMKDPTRSIALIKELYTRMKLRTKTGRVMCRVEANAFQSMYRKELMKEKIACVPYNSTKDKLTRFLEHQ